ncbi:hypothetical protein Y695_04300 [Hydrogenophaga sp. T4]|nr:hypothetical protein Y695_04300 [Hydrogenophaga sp. T4]
MKVSCAAPQGASKPSVGTEKSLRTGLFRSTAPQLGRLSAQGPNSRPPCFRLRKFSPLTQIRSTEPSVRRPAATSVCTRLTTSAASVTLTWRSSTP